MTTISLSLSVPPSVNKCWANVPGKGRVRTKAYREWAKAAEWDIHIASLKQGKITGRFRVTIRLCVNGDIDNYVKSCIDACQSARAIGNDNDMDELHVYRSDVPGLTLVLESLD